MNRPVNKAEFVQKLHYFIMSHNKDIGAKHGLSDQQLNSIMDQQKRDNMLLCEHVYDFLRLEGYVDGP
jgi:hypothetical protein